MATADAGDVRPPYGPWSAFETFVRGLHGSVIPPRVDNSLLSKLSGTSQSQLRGALRFFGLVRGDEDAVTDRLAPLVAASQNKDTWQAALAELVPAAYARITEGVDLQAGTRAQLDEAFRERAKVSGSMNRKAVRFFLTAMAEAGQKLSPFFDPATTSGSSTRASGVRKAPPRRNRSRKGNNEAAEQPPRGMQKVTCSIPGGREVVVWLPADLSQPEQEFLLMYLGGYFKLGQNPGGSV